MPLEILPLLGLLLVALVLFATEVVSVDVAGLILLLALYFTGLLSEREIFLSFGDEVILFLGSLFVVTEGLVRTGALDEIERLLLRQAERRPRLLYLIILVGMGVVSAFLSNTATMAAFLPVAMALSRKLEEPPSKLLMPLAFAAILGGTCTLIGTSTNIVVSGSLPRFQLEPLSLFELAPVGAPILGVGLAYLLLLGRRLLPSRGEEGPLVSYGVRAYLTEALVPKRSPWAGKTLRETRAGQELDINILGLADRERGLVPAGRQHRLKEGDVLLIEATPSALLRLKERPEIQLLADDKWGPGARVEAMDVHEVLLAPYSRLAGKSLKELQFRNRFHVTALAIYRRLGPIQSRVGHVRLRDGDVLLLQGDLSRLENYFRSGDLIHLERLKFRRRGRRAWIAAGVFAAMILAGGLEWIPFSMAAVTAAGVLLLTRCLTPTEAYGAVDWRILVMVACLLGLGTAMETSGTAGYLAQLIAHGSADAGPLAVLAGFYLLTVLLTQSMSNQAAALVVLPLAIRTAEEMALNPRTFAITVCLAASSSFLTPLEPASLLVYGPGRYRFRDYFKVGLPLTVLAFVLTLLLVPRLWPL